MKKLLIAIAFVVSAAYGQLNPSGATTVLPVPIKTPAAGDNGKAVVYDSATGRYIYAPAGGATPAGSSGDVQTNNGSGGLGAAPMNCTGSSCTIGTTVIDPVTGITTPKVTTGSGSGVAGVLDLLQGTLPTFPTNAFSLLAPTSIPTSYHWVVPSADGAGAIASNGSGTLSIVGFSGTGNIARVTSPTFVTPVLGAATATSVSATTLTATSSLVAQTAMTLSFIASGTQCLHVNSSGVVSGTGADCGSGGGGGATTSLDNLSAVSINTSLLAQTGIDLGSTTKPFRDLYLFGAGTFGSTYLKLTGTPTSTRTVTFPDATDTVAELGQANAFTAANTLTLTSLGNAPTTGYKLVNSTAATNIVQHQYSPCAVFSGQYWTGSTSQQSDWCITNAAYTGQSFLLFNMQQNGGGYVQSAAISGATSGTNLGTFQIGLVSASSGLHGATGADIRVDYYQDVASAKGFFDTTVSGFNFMTENRVNGNVNLAIRAKSSQSADLLQLLAAGGTTVLSKFDVAGNLTIVPQKSTTGTRYLCIDSAGLVASSASACSGT